MQSRVLTTFGFRIVKDPPSVMEVSTGSLAKTALEESPAFGALAEWPSSLLKTSSCLFSTALMNHKPPPVLPSATQSIY